MTTTDTRSTEILESVKTTFAQKGFDGASMKDLAEAAGMSAGNFYRYFSSKNGIVEAMIERELVTLREDFANVLSAPDPRRAMTDLVRLHLHEKDCDSGTVWAEIEAAASRRPEIAAIKARIDTEISRSLIAVLARIAKVSDAEARIRFDAHSRLIILLVKGLSMQPPSSGDAASQRPDRALADLVLATIDQLLAGVVASAASPERNKS